MLDGLAYDDLGEEHLELTIRESGSILVAVGARFQGLGAPLVSVGDKNGAIGPVALEVGLVSNAADRL